MTGNAESTGGLAGGLEGHATAIVTDELTAPALGSGSIRVYGTPAMIALMERAAVDCVDRHLPTGQATVGIHLDAAHMAATPPGMNVSATAKLNAIEGRKLTFFIEARDEAGSIGEATHVRMIVDVARFEEKLSEKTSRS
jgi:fluoroacetyl-CoA thioesterase